MADLQLIGAVGVRVRPDTKGFRNEAKREILSQLKDIEGESNVRVDPNIQFNEAEAKKAFSKAFKNIDLPEEVYFRPVLDERAFAAEVQKIARTKIPKLTPIRIDADASAANSALAELGNELEDIHADLTRMPKDLERLEGDYKTRFDSITKSVKKTNEAITAHTEGLEDSARKVNLHREVVTEAKQAEAAAQHELNRLRADEMLALDKIAAAKQDYHEVEGRAAKARQTAIKAEGQAELRFIRDRMKIARSALTTAEDRRKEVVKTLEALQEEGRVLKKNLATEEKSLKTQQDSLAEAEKAYSAEQASINASIKAHQERERAIKKEREAQEILLNSISKNDNQLRASLDQFGLPLEFLRRKMAVLTKANGDLYQTMRMNIGAANAQVKSDLEELFRRVREFGELRQQQLATERRLREEMRVNNTPGFEGRGQMADWDDQLNRAKQFADEATAYINSKRPQIVAQPQLDPLALVTMGRVLDVATRERTVNIKPRVLRSRLHFSDPDGPMDFPINLRVGNAKKLAADIAEAFSGVGIARTITREFKSAMTGFDQLAISAATTALKIGTVTSASLSAVAVLSALTADLGELVAIALLAPASMTTLATAIYSSVKGFEQFSEAVDGDAEALATFNDSGQRAARLLGELKAELNERVKPSFWEGLGDDLENLAEAIAPGGPLLHGIVESAHHVGRAWGGVFRSLEKFAESGQMATAFENMEEGLDELANSTEPLFDAINRIGLVGSRYLPRFGRWATEGAENFRDWAIAADEAGDMERWIERSIDHMQSLGSITGSTVGIIDSLADVANRAGFGGLASLAAGLAAVNEAARGEFFQTNMENLFRGSLGAIESMASGFRDLGRDIMAQSEFIEAALELMGRVVGSVFTDIGSVLDNPRLLGGVAEMLADIEEAAGGLQPLFEMSAGGIGDASRLFGEMVKGAVDIAEAFLTVWNNAQNLTAALEDLIPWMTNLTAAMVELTHVPITALMNGLAGLIQGFLGMPGPLQAAALGLGAMLLLGPKLRLLGQYFQRMGRNAQHGVGRMGQAMEAWRNAMGTGSLRGREFMLNSQMLTRQQREIARLAYAWRDAGRHWRDASTAMGQANRGLKDSLSNLRPVAAAIDRTRQRQQDLTRAFLDSSDKSSAATAQYLREYQRLGTEIARLRNTYSGMASVATNAAGSTATAWIRSARDTVRSTRQAGRDFASAWANATRQAGREVTGHFAQQGRAAGRAMTDGLVRAVRNFSLADTLDPSRLITPYFNQAVQDLRSQFRDLATYSRAAGITAGNNLRTGFQNALRPIGENLRRVMSDAMSAVRLGMANERGSVGHLGWVFKDQFREVERSAREMARAVNESTRGVQGSTQTMGRAFEAMQSGARNAATGVRNAFSGFSQWPAIATARAQVDYLNASLGTLAPRLSAIRTGPFISSMGAVSTAAGSAARAVGMTAGAGLNAAAAGLMGALGGPWGLVIAGATTALILFGQAAADQRQKIKSLRETLDEFGEVTDDTARNVAQSMNDVKAGFGENLRVWGTTVGDVLRKLGTNSSEVANQMVNDRGAYEEYATALRELSWQAAPTEEALKRFSDASGISTERLKTMGPELVFLSAELDKAAGYVDSAQDSFTNLHGSMAPASEHGQRLAESLSKIADEASPASERVQALNDALALLNGEDISAEDAIARMHEGIRNFAGDLPGYVEEYKNFTDVIDDNTGKIDRNTPAGFALGEMLTAVADKAREAGIASEDMEGAMTTARDGFLKTARDAGLPEESIRQLELAWDSYVKTPQEHEKAVKLSGAAEAMKLSEELVNTLGLDWDQQRFEAWLDADPANAELAAQDATAAATKFANDKYLAEFGVTKDDFDIAMAEAEERGQDWDAAEYTAWLTGDPENARLAADDAQAAARKFADDTYGARFSADGTHVGKTIGELEERLEGFTGNSRLWAMKFTANDDQFLAVMDSAKAKGAEITNKDAFKAFISANAEDFLDKGYTVDKILEAWTTVPHDVRVNGATEDAMWKLEEVDGKLQWIAENPATAKVDAETQGALDALYLVDEAVLGWDGETFSADLDGNPQPFIQAKGEAEGEGWLWDGEQFISTLTGDPLPFSQAKSLAEGEGLLYDTNVFTADLDGDPALMAGAKAAADEIGLVWDGATWVSDLDGNPHPFVQAKGEADGVGLVWDGATWTSTLDGDEQPAKESKDRADGYGQDWDISRYDGHYDADTSGAWQGLADGILAGLEWARQKFYATFGTKNENANGNLYAGTAFAHGGFADGRAVRRFADGGFSDRERRALNAALNSARRENHRAMIATPKTPFRIWAEPETQGEAYIPLAASKRARSTAIWEATGNRLGVDWQTYAEGGLTGGSKSSSSGSGRYGKNITVNVSNHYPQAEPTSVTTNRALQLAANL